MSKVLIIEDDPIEGRLYHNLFTLEGFEVVVVASGSEGIEKAISWNPDIIILDIMMPKMNGFVTFDILKHKPITKKIPVIMLTNLSGEENKKAALDKGVTAYLIKSNTENRRLIALVRDIIDAYARSSKPNVE